MGYDDDTVMNTDDGGGSGSICVSLSSSERKGSPACSWSSKSDSCTSASLKLAKQYDDDTVMNTDDGGGSGSICVSLSSSECKRSPACSWSSKSDSCTSASLKLAKQYDDDTVMNTDDGGGS